MSLIDDYLLLYIYRPEINLKLEIIMKKIKVIKDLFGLKYEV